MKNKKFLVIVATALMVCLVAGMGAMTYSKYITSSKTTNQATAAQWGFVVSANATNLFANAYKGSPAVFAGYTEDGVCVKANAEARKLVAPGTTGSMTFSISGTAEVKAQITMSITGIGEINYGGTYYPVIWTLKKDGVTVGTPGKLVDVVATLSSVNETLYPGQEASTMGEYILSWEWPLETGDDANAKAQNNVYDTLIGFKARNMDWASIVNTYVGNIQITEAAYGSIYNATPAKIITAMEFDLNINIEQVQ